jgi:hypothetical protein
MPRDQAIMAYGTRADRLRAAVMAKLAKKSTSEWLLKSIRDQYAAVYGDADPEKIHAGLK